MEPAPDSGLIVRWAAVLSLVAWGCGGPPEAPALAEAPPAAETPPPVAPQDEAPPAGKIGGEPILPDPVVMGGISRDQVDLGLAPQRAGIVGCWEEGRKANPELRGKVLVKFTIAKDGTVKSTTTRSTSLRSEATEACVNQQIALAKFAPLASGELAIVTYPFAFPPG